MDGASSVFSPASRLTALQRDLLLEFFAREQRFFLTGGAALSRSVGVWPYPFFFAFNVHSESEGRT